MKPKAYLSHTVVSILFSLCLTIPVAAKVDEARMAEGIQRFDKVQVMTIGPNGGIQCGGGVGLPVGTTGAGSERQAKENKLVRVPGVESLPAPSPVNFGFAPNLYQQLRSTEGNVFFSPYSISEAMAMVHAGAGGDTASQIAKALAVARDSTTLTSQIELMRQHLQQRVKKGENRLNIANALCVTGMEPLQAYKEIVRKQFQGELFTGGLGRINDWVKKKTEGRIETILDKLAPNSACVLLNAVYFKGNWKTPFKASNTHKASFHLSSTDKVTVDMMSREGMFRVVREERWIALELPYETSASMVLMLPVEPKGMDDLEASLNESMLQDVMQQLSSAKKQRAKLFLPKFKLATSYNLIKAIKHLGVVDAFDFDKADFRAMYGERDVAISQIMHKATLEVDEMGSVASAATAVEMQTRGVIIEQAPQLRFDRPFLCMIRERSSGTILFMGRISDPTAE
ncbi:MAG: serpin family protein [Opitutales bacterium]